MDAGKMMLNQLLINNRILKIPFFQRAYVWKKDLWERFLNDMSDVSDKDYFMGAIIIKQKILRQNNFESEIIDGQQRLTTIILFLKALLKSNKNSDSENDFNFNYVGGGIILEHNYNDKTIFEAILTDKLHDQIRKDYKGNKVLECYEYFKECLTDDERKEEFKNLNFDNILKHLFFISIELDDEDNKQKIFDTMNSLGESLSTGALLKNTLFDESEKELYEDNWRKTFEDDENIKNFWDYRVLAGRSPRTHMDLLLQSFLLIKYPDHGERQYQRADQLFDNYKEVLNKNKILENKNDKEVFIKELIGYAKLYEEHIAPHHLMEALTNDSKDTPITQRLNIIMFTMGSTSVISFVLYILKTVEDDEEKEKIFKLLETYLMRRIIASEHSTNYTNYFSRHIRANRNSYEELHQIMYKSQDLSSNMPVDKSLDDSFDNRKFANSTNRLILYFLEHKKRPEESATGLLAINNYSVEHIMPANWKKHWSNNLPEGNNVEIEQERNERIRSLGNLTLLTPKLNSSLSNAAWELKKKGRKDEKGKRDLKGLQECCDGMATISRYFGYDDWNEEAIKERGKELLEIAKDLWKYEE